MKFAIIGATGNVGRKTIDILEKSKLDIEQLYLVASKNSSGKKIKFKGEDHTVIALEKYDFEKLPYDEKFDVFLYKRIGKRMLKMMTTGLFIRPYAAVSLREYFATGFEAFFLGEKNELYKISPVLYEIIANLE